ncbi:Asp-tRNA(Asn)/Glu-tRNA(Gln) amidotransferase subunit GatA [Candidatus Roizmanbacteria bacterium]|nr:Asp-tRNA(Asn)/Glu-tRNA(Gln) amidotransferase subunit GatA [Candidatus Roizmanbacteria bacterium]
MELSYKSITELRKLLQEKKISPEELYSYYVNRIKKLNPMLNAYLTVLDKPNIDYSKKDQPLFGIPFSMKDTYNVKGIKTTAASKVLEHHISSYDSTVYVRLRDAGAVLIGKTNCDAWGHGVSTVNSDFGVTKNPWNLEYVPGGSSGGSGAALVADLCTFSIAEDTAGSIRCPASFCSVTGLKVTYGLVSRYGCIAFASSLDTVGPMAKNVEDLALVLEIIAGRDIYDATSSSQQIPKYTQGLHNKISGMKLGVPKEYFTEGVDEEVAANVESAIKIFEKLGVKAISISLPMTKYAIATYYLINPSETSSNLARYDGIRYGGNRDLFGAEAKRRIMLGTFALSAGYYDAYYKKATKMRTLIRKDFAEAFKKVDFLIGPVNPTPPFKIGEKTHDPLTAYLEDVFTAPINLAGIPSLALPAGFTKNKLPIGFQIIGKHFDEAKLLNIGYQYEQEAGINAKPEI